MNGMDFTEYDPNRMEKVYKGYYAVLQNLITSIMFQRNLVDAYSKIIGVLKNINSKIKIGKRGANRNKEIKALQNSIKKLTANGQKARNELEKKIKGASGKGKPGAGEGTKPKGKGKPSTPAPAAAPGAASP